MTSIKQKIKNQIKTIKIPHSLILGAIALIFAANVSKAQAADYEKLDDTKKKAIAFTILEETATFTDEQVMDTLRKYLPPEKLFTFDYMYKAMDAISLDIIAGQISLMQTLESQQKLMFEMIANNGGTRKQSKELADSEEKVQKLKKAINELEQIKNTVKTATKAGAENIYTKTRATNEANGYKLIEDPDEQDKLSSDVKEIVNLVTKQKGR
ncbi:MAG: hypothetical protein LBJ73_00545 [Rickettsiales bacterium]|jgi:hypothetical protein|nr:hypothetical protein [Rickettsiales bacterium]